MVRWSVFLGQLVILSRPFFTAAAKSSDRQMASFTPGGLAHRCPAVGSVYSSAGCRKESGRRPGWSVRLTYLSASRCAGDHRARAFASLSNTSELVPAVVSAGCYLWPSLFNTSKNLIRSVSTYPVTDPQGIPKLFYVIQDTKDVEFY